MGRLVELAFEAGRAVNSHLETGVCGEHGGDPASIHFFHRAGLDHVSRSPVPDLDGEAGSGRAALTGAPRHRQQVTGGASTPLRGTRALGDAVAGKAEEVPPLAARVQSADVGPRAGGCPMVPDRLGAAPSPPAGPVGPGRVPFVGRGIGGGLGEPAAAVLGSGQRPVDATG
ncbi:putative PEP-binding protein [Streptomyces massasporeus]|uniref:putative PEP-binding protein n=1 Tax=Streptomyces massasporeus TaxID=67324 RepID=UPI00382D38DD